MDIDMNELRRRRDEINMLSAQAKWDPPDETGCKITYLRVRPGTLGNGLSEGICFAYDCQKRKAKEQPKLRKGTKHYIRLVRRDGKLLRVDKYTDGEIDVVHLGQEIDGVRYMFPFFEDGTPYLTYTYATHWRNGHPTAEYACSGGQILRWTYDYREDGSIGVSYVNAVPDGNEPIICWSTADYYPREEITLQQTGYWDFWMKDPK